MGEKKAHIHAPQDNVAVALEDLESGDTVTVKKGGSATSIVVTGPVPFGHKLALEAIEAGADVTKYGGFIGKATKAIAEGEHVHVHNIKGVKYT